MCFLYCLLRQGSHQSKPHARRFQNVPETEFCGIGNYDVHLRMFWHYSPVAPYNGVCRLGRSHAHLSLAARTTFWSLAELLQEMQILCFSTLDWVTRVINRVWSRLVFHVVEDLGVGCCAELGIPSVAHKWTRLWWKWSALCRRVLSIMENSPLGTIQPATCDWISQ